MDWPVIAVRRAYAPDYSHKHIIGVITPGGYFTSNADVIISLNAGNTWHTQVAGEPRGNIREHDYKYCPATSCYLKPYLQTDADGSRKNNLENMPDA